MQKASNKVLRSMLLCPLAAQISEENSEFLHDEQRAEELLLNTIKVRLSQSLCGGQPKKKFSCAKSIRDILYICYDCRLTMDSYLCEECFLRFDHSRCHHQAIKIEPRFEGVFSCGCGDQARVRGASWCKDHQHYLDSPPIVLDTFENIKQNLVQCFKIAVCLVFGLEFDNSISRSGEQRLLLLHIVSNYLERLFELLESKVSSTFDYHQVIQQAFLTKVRGVQTKRNSANLKRFCSSQEDMSLLQVMYEMRIAGCKSLFETVIIELLQLQDQQFVRSVFQVAHLSCCQQNLAQEFSFLRKIRASSSITDYQFCKYLCQFARHIKSLKQPKLVISFYCEHLQQHGATVDPANARTYRLVECWKELDTQRLLTPENVNATGRAMGAVLGCAVHDQQLFDHAFENFFSFVLEKVWAGFDKQGPKKQSVNLSESMNVMARALFQFSKGESRKWIKVLEEKKLSQKFCQLWVIYVSRCIQRKYNLNYLCLLVMGLYLHEVKIQKPHQYQIYLLAIKQTTQNLSSEMINSFLKKFLNIMLGQSFKNLAKVQGLLNIKSSQSTALKVKLLKQLLYMCQRIPLKFFKILEKEDALSFPQAKQIISQYTRYDSQSQQLVYASEQKYFSWGNIVHNLTWLEKQEVQFQFEEQEMGSQFREQFNKQVFTSLLLPVLSLDKTYEGLPQEQMMSDSNAESLQLEKWVNLIIINKAVDGSVPMLRGRLLEKKQELSQSNKQGRLRKLFGLNTQSQIHDEGLEKSSINNSLAQQKQTLDSQNLSKTPDRKQSHKIQTWSEEKKQQPKGQNLDIQTPVETPSKKQAILQKMKKKQQDFLKSSPIKVEQAQQHHQICIICRDTEGQNCQFYHAGRISLNVKIPLILQTGFSFHRLDYCKHSFDEKCLEMVYKSINNECPYCKKPTNLPLPYGAAISDPKAQLVLKNRFAGIKNKIGPLVNQDIDDEFNFFLNMIIQAQAEYLLLGLMADQTKSFNQQTYASKGQYGMGVLKEWWHSLEPVRKQFYCQTMPVYNAHIDVAYFTGVQHLGEPANPKQAINRVVANILWGWMTQTLELQLPQIKAQLSVLRQALTQKQFSRVIGQLQKVFSKCSQSLVFQEQGEPLQPEGECTVFDLYFPCPYASLLSLHLPQKCMTCLRVRNHNQEAVIFCILCGQTYCPGCQHRQLHQAAKAHIQFGCGMLICQLEGEIERSHIYRSRFGESLTSANPQRHSIFEFELSPRAFRQGITHWICAIIKKH